MYLMIFLDVIFFDRCQGVTHASREENLYVYIDIQVDKIDYPFVSSSRRLAEKKLFSGAFKRLNRIPEEYVKGARPTLILWS